MIDHEMQPKIKIGLPERGKKQTDISRAMGMPTRFEAVFI
jgi:hypothetical protein